MQSRSSSLWNSSRAVAEDFAMLGSILSPTPSVNFPEQQRLAIYSQHEGAGAPQGNGRGA